MAEEFLGRLFKQIHLAFYAKATEDMRETQITPAQMDILLFLMDSEQYNLSVTQKDIERRLRLSNPTVTGVLNRLEEKDLICRVTKEDDKRCRIILFTEKARGLLVYLNEQRLEGEVRMVKGLTPEQVRLLREMLLVILANLTEEVENF